MQIRDLDLANAGEIQAFYRVFRDAEQAGNADRPVWPEALLTSQLTTSAGDEKSYAYAAFDDPTGRMVGAAFAFLPLLDNTTKAYAGVFVAPDDRQQGVGSALLDHLLTQVETLGRSTVLIEATYGFDSRDDHPYRRFAERRGFALASTEVRRTLTLPIAGDTIRGWIDETAPHHADYRIETFVNDLPDELLPSVCHVANQLILDAPTGDIEFEAEMMTPEIRRKHDKRATDAGLTRYETVAVDRTGAAVAISALGVQAGEADKAMQWATIVQKEHRGHRLGLAVKAHNLRALQREQPQVRSISTSNEEHNAHMVSINERLGFVPVELMVEFQRTLGG